MQFNTHAVGAVIRSLRKKRRLSQDTVSGLAGIARTHLTMIENGTKQPNLETIWKIAQAMDIKASKLIQLVEDALECEDNHTL